MVLSHTLSHASDEEIYKKMTELLEKYHQEKSKELRECIIEEMQSKDEAQNFPEEYLSDERKIAEEMEVLLPTYEKFCTSSRIRIEVLSVIIGGIIFIAILIIVAICNNRLQPPSEPFETVETVV